MASVGILSLDTEIRLAGYERDRKKYLDSIRNLGVRAGNVMAAEVTKGLTNGIANKKTGIALRKELSVGTQGLDKTMRRALLRAIDGIGALLKQQLQTGLTGTTLPRSVIQQYKAIGAAATQAAQAQQTVNNFASMGVGPAMTRGQARRQQRGGQPSQPRTRNQRDLANQFDALDIGAIITRSVLKANIASTIGFGIASGIKDAIIGSIATIRNTLSGLFNTIFGDLTAGIRSTIGQNSVSGQISQAMGVEAQDINAAAAISSIGKIDFSKAQRSVERTKARLAKVAAIEAGENKDYQMLLAGFQDDLIKGFVGEDGRLDDKELKALEDKSASIVKNIGVIAANSGRGSASWNGAIGTLTKMLNGASMRDLQSDDFFQKDAKQAFAELQRILNVMGVKTIGELSDQSQIEVIDAIFQAGQSRERSEASAQTMDAIIQEAKSKLFDASSGVFSIQRNLGGDGEKDSVFESIKDTVRETVGFFEELGKVGGAAGIAIGDPMVLLNNLVKSLNSTISSAKSNLAEFFASQSGQQLVTVFDQIKTSVAALPGYALQTIQTFGPAAMAIISGALNVASTVMPMVQQLGQAVAPVITLGAQMLSTMVTNGAQLASTVMPLLLKGVGAVVGNMVNLANQVLPSVEAGFGTVTTLITNAVAGVEQVVGGAGIGDKLSTVQGVLQGVFESVTRLTQSASELVIPVIEFVIDGVSRIADQIMPSVSDAAEGVLRVFWGMSDVAGQLFKTAKSIFIDVFAGGGAQDAVSAIADTMGNMLSMLGDMLSGVGDMLSYIAKQQELWDVIAFVVGGALKAGVYAIKQGIGLINISLKAVKVLWDASLVVIKLVIGSINTIVKIIKTGWNPAAETVKYIFNSIWETGGKIIDFITLGVTKTNAFKSVWDLTKGAVVGVAKAVKDLLGGALQSAINGAKSFLQQLGLIKDQSMSIQPMAAGAAANARFAQGGSASDADKFVGAVLSILEAPTRQGRVDVAQVIANRVGTNFGGYGGTIRDQAFASGQFQPFFQETYGIGRNDIKDRESAIAALKKAGRSTQQAATALDQFFADIGDAAKVADTASKVGGRAYFKGVSQYRHMRQGADFLRQRGENFFHHEDKDTRNRTQASIAALFGNAAAASAGGGGASAGQRTTAKSRHGRNTITRVQRTGRKDRYGGEILELQLIKDGVVIDSVLAASGSPSNQTFEKRGQNTQRARSMAPLPEGVYGLGRTQRTSGSFGEGLGSTWVSITDRPGSSNLNIRDSGRSAFGFHEDSNRFTGKPGSAGCVVFYDKQATKKVAGWVDKYGVDELHVDWGLGTFKPSDRTQARGQRAAGRFGIDVTDGQGNVSIAVRNGASGGAPQAVTVQSGASSSAAGASSSSASSTDQKAPSLLGANADELKKRLKLADESVKKLAELEEKNAQLRAKRRVEDEKLKRDREKADLQYKADIAKLQGPNDAQQRQILANNQAVKVASRNYDDIIRQRSRQLEDIDKQIKERDLKIQKAKVAFEKINRGVEGAKPFSLEALGAAERKQAGIGADLKPLRDEVQKSLDQAKQLKELRLAPALEKVKADTDKLTKSTKELLQAQLKLNSQYGETSALLKHQIAQEELSKRFDDTKKKAEAAKKAIELQLKSTAITAEQRKKLTDQLGQVTSSIAGSDANRDTALAKARERFEREQRDRLDKTIRDAAQFSDSEQSETVESRFARQAQQRELRFKQLSLTLKQSVEDYRNAAKIDGLSAEQKDKLTTAIGRLQMAQLDLVKANAKAIANSKEQLKLDQERAKTALRNQLLGTAQSAIAAEAEALQKYQPLLARELNRQSAMIDLAKQQEQSELRLKQSRENRLKQLREGDINGALNAVGLGDKDAINAQYEREVAVARAQGRNALEGIRQQYPTLAEELRENARNAFSGGLANGLKSFVSGQGFDLLGFAQSIADVFINKGIDLLTQNATNALFGGAQDDKGFLGEVEAVSAIDQGTKLAAQNIIQGAMRAKAILEGAAIPPGAKNPMAINGLDVLQPDASTGVYDPKDVFSRFASFMAQNNAVPFGQPLTQSTDADAFGLGSNLADAFVTTAEDSDLGKKLGESFGQTGSNTLSGLLSNILSGDIGGLVGSIGSIIGLSDGGVVPRQDHSAYRAMPGAIGDALRREGGNSILAALTPGEMVLSRAQTARFLSGQAPTAIPNYARGTMPALSGGVTSSSTTNSVQERAVTQSYKFEYEKIGDREVVGRDQLQQLEARLNQRMDVTSQQATEGLQNQLRGDISFRRNLGISGPR